VLDFRMARLMASLALAVCAIWGCGDDEDPSSPSLDRRTITEFVSSASIAETGGALRTSAIPRPTDGGPAISVDGHLVVVNGGTTTLTVTSPTPFKTVYVAGSAPVSRLFVPVNGYFEIPLAAPTTSASLLLVFPQALPGDKFDLYFAVADSTGLVGAQIAETVNPIIVGTGDIQVTVAWDEQSDVDLHVVDPSGYEICWVDPESPSGGKLDLDSNAACLLDGVRNENITWATGTAPQGTYTVRVDYWSDCGVSRTDFTVLINNGGQVSIYDGSFTGSGDNGGVGSGVEIATFTRTTGPTAPPMRNRPVHIAAGSKSRMQE
jgi:hypothetical protein